MDSGTFSLELPSGEIIESRSEDLCLVARELGLLTLPDTCTLSAREYMERMSPAVEMLEDLKAGRLE